MQPPKPLAVLVESLMEAHQLTVSSLGSLLGKKAELKKLLAGKLEPDKCDQLVSNLSELKQFSHAEKRMLLQSAMANRLGLQTYLSRYSFQHLLDSRENAGSLQLCMSNGRPFRECIDQWKSEDQLEILCLNCCIRPLMTELSHLLQQNAATFIRQYAAPDQRLRNYAVTLYAAFPLLFESHYKLFLLDCAGQKENPYFLSDDIMLVRACKAGVWKERLFLFREQQQVFELPLMGGTGLLPAMQSFLEQMASFPASTDFSLENPQDHCISLLGYLGREMNRQFWSVNEGLPFFAYPGDIMHDVFMDSGFFLKDMAQVKKMLTLHQHRLNNVLKGKKHCYFTASIRGLEQFMNTGTPSEHMQSARAFTMDERIGVLRFFLAALRGNPAIHFRLYREADFQPECYFAGYEGDVVLLSRHTMEICTNGLPYAIISNPHYINEYRDYYMNQLLPEKCMSDEESLRYVEELYDAYCVKKITFEGAPDDQPNLIAYC